jgi:phosphoribosylanthranilate isomerase
METKICNMLDKETMSRTIPTHAGIIPDKAPESNNQEKEVGKRVGIFNDEMPQTIITRVVQYALDAIQLQGNETPTLIRNLRTTLNSDIHPGIQIWKGLPLTKEGLEMVSRYEDCVDGIVFYKDKE